MFAIIGGKKDFNIDYFSRGLKNYLSHPFEEIRFSDDYIPTLSYNLEEDILEIDQRKLKFKHLYIRRDVLNSVKFPAVSNSWYRIFRSYGLSHPKVTMFNKNYIGMNKTRNLRIANKLNIKIPKTIVTNGLHSLLDIPNKSKYIVKQLGGGTYTQTLKDYIQDNMDKIKSNMDPVVFLQES